MEFVTVYNYKVYDILKDDYILGKRKATLGAIKSIKAVALEDSAEDVDPNKLDGDGFLSKNL